MTRQVSLLAGVAFGTGAVYLLDPERGARRRARVRDLAVHSAHVARRALGTAGRDAVHRTRGAATSLLRLVRHEPVTDDVLVQRVRARLGRLVSHPHAIEVTAVNGAVTLGGPVLEREARRLVRAIGCAPGVRDVVDRLERHERAAHVPSLQGGRAPSGDRADVLQTHWAPATRAIMGTTGAVLVVSGILRRGLPGMSAAATGAGLLARAVTNLPINRLTGIAARRRAVDLQKTITINAPLGEVYAFWSEYDNFPKFMSRVLNVTASDRVPKQSHWQVAGPAGAPVEFDAELTRVVPNRTIGWRTLPGSAVGHAGIVRFDSQADGTTRVHLRMSYNPPAGWLGHGIARAFGVDPKHSLDEDLVRMKTLIETGHAPHDAAHRERQEAARRAGQRR